MCKRSFYHFTTSGSPNTTAKFNIYSNQAHRATPHSQPRASLLSDISPTETERCIESLIAVFQKHAGRDSNNSKLSKAKFLIFMNTELGAFTKNQKYPGVLDRMMKKLDLNSDGQLDFQEFLNLIGGLAIACHDSFIKSTSSQK
ncbi:protein S100-A11-like [Orcinus orca]|uniref:protein S100-A11-like n=1 Tax=Orcinus orca TaxID=9733 RepID=UPI0021114EB5|nr:protein S100-A11-like [Orcinus orca]